MPFPGSPARQPGRGRAASARWCRLAATPSRSLPLVHDSRHTHVRTQTQTHTHTRTRAHVHTHITRPTPTALGPNSSAMIRQSHRRALALRAGAADPQALAVRRAARGCPCWPSVHHAHGVHQAVLERHLGGNLCNRRRFDAGVRAPFVRPRGACAPGRVGSGWGGLGWRGQCSSNQTHFGRLSTTSHEPRATSHEPHVCVCVCVCASVLTASTHAHTHAVHTLSNTHAELALEELDVTPQGLAVLGADLQCAPGARNGWQLQRQETTRVARLNSRVRCITNTTRCQQQRCVAA